MHEPNEFDVLVPDPEVRRELGEKSEMTFWRWDKDPAKGPPGWEPPVRIGNRKFRRRSTIETIKANLIRRALAGREVA